MNVEVKLPARFTLDSMQQFIEAAMRACCSAGVTGIVIDLSELQYIEPEGLTALTNAIEYFKHRGLLAFLKGHQPNLPVTTYLEHAGFFRLYLGRQVTPGRVTNRIHTLSLFKANQYVSYLYTGLMPWLATELRTQNDTLETIKVCLEEVFHNVGFHAEIDTGCAFAEHFPQRKRIHISISDWGVGIPYNVRRITQVGGDAEALVLAAREGFTTGLKPRNRGAGLPNLIKYVVQRNAGEVNIYSGDGQLRASRGPSQPYVDAQPLKWCYPGTLVRVVLRTDRLDRVESDVKPEEFRW